MATVAGIFLVLLAAFAVIMGVVSMIGVLHMAIEYGDEKRREEKKDNDETG